MIYKLMNIEDDDFVAAVLAELGEEICSSENENIKLIEEVKSNRRTKGDGISELIIQLANWCISNESFFEGVIGGVVAAGVYDLLRAVVHRFKRTPEYNPEKKIKIVQKDEEGNENSLIISVQDIVEKDIR